MTTRCDPGGMMRAEAFRVLARAVDEERNAKLRFATRVPVVGFHGEDFEQRWRRVERIVSEHNRRAVHAALSNALRAGWTPAELNASGLTLEEGER